MVFDLDMIKAVYKELPARIARAKRQSTNPLLCLRRYCMLIFTESRRQKTSDVENPTLTFRLTA